MLIAAIAILVTAVCSIGLFYSILVQQIYDDLKANAHVISRLDFEDASQEVCDQLSGDGLRITLIASDGTVLYDSMEDETKMENHRGRPEVERALAVGEGRGLRKSTTSAQHTFYYAMRLSDGSVLRIGKESGSIYHLAWNMTMLTLGVGLCVFLVCAFFAKRMTERFVEPIEKMADNIVLVDEREVYEEMRPFVSMIKQQHVDILNHAQMRQEFTANVSHELKTPLTAISGYAELIEHGMSGENTERFASEIHKNAARLLTLINDIIQLSQLDGGKKDVEYRDLDLFPLARECVDMLQMNAQKQNVTIRVQGGEAPVFADKQLMEELIYNLCDNAIRYNKKDGTVTVTTGIENGHTFLSVKDTGIGISAEHQERVFERFYRVDKSRSKATGGTGLGLAIVKHIVAQHGAKLTLESEQGKGTEIRVEFSEALKQHEIETAKQRQEVHAERSENGSSD